MSEKTPEVKPFNCPKCGGRLNLYAGELTKTVACSHCGSVLDLSSEDGKILAVYQQKTSERIAPLIPLGSRGSLHSETVTVIGYMVRRTKIEGITYRWAEYLLYAGEHGFRWLTEYQGHWNYVRTVTDVPKTPPGRGWTPQTIRHRDLDYQHFQSADSEVEYVLGEFYWQVRVGEEAEAKDYISPPFMLSSETTKKEITWSLGLYTEPAEIYNAFKIKPLPESRSGVFANQLNPHKSLLISTRMLTVCFCVVAFMLYSFLAARAQNKTVDAETMQYAASDIEKSRITNAFPVDGHAANLAINLSTNLDNNWAFFGMALINLETDEAIDFGKEISYYHGYDSDGGWSEGKTYGTTILPSVPPGQYYLRIEPEAQLASMTYSIEVKRDVPRPLYLIITLLLLIIPWFYLEFASYSFEVARWSESDHPMTNEDSDDDDEPDDEDRTSDDLLKGNPFKGK